MDTSKDTFALDSDGKIWTYTESGKGENTLVCIPSKNEKPLVPQGQTRGGLVGAAYPI